MVAYAYPYIIVAGLLTFFYIGECGRIKGLSPRKSINYAYLLMLIFIGLRGFVLTDFINYYDLYNNIPQLSKLDLSNFVRVEPGFALYTSIIKTIGFNYFGWVFINTLIDLIVFRYFFKNYSPSLVLPLICMMAFQGILIEFNLYRNIKAIELFLLSLPYLTKRKFIPYLLLNLIGLSFHNSAIIYIPLYFVLTIKINQIIVWGIIAFTNIIYLCHISVISDIINNISFMQVLNGYEKLMNYAASSENKTFSIGFFERTFAIILFTVFRKRLTQKHSYYNVFYNCYLIFYSSFLLFYEIPVFVQRIPALFSFSYWILYPGVIYLHYRWRQVINLSISLLLFLKIYASHADPFYKYENILWSNVDYQKAYNRTTILMNHIN